MVHHYVISMLRQHCVPCLQLRKLLRPVRQRMTKMSKPSTSKKRHKRSALCTEATHTARAAPLKRRKPEDDKEARRNLAQDSDAVIDLHAILSAAHGVKFGERDGIVFMLSCKAAGELQRGDVVVSVTRAPQVDSSRRKRAFDDDEIDLTGHILPSQYPLLVHVQRRVAAKTQETAANESDEEAE